MSSAVKLPSTGSAESKRALLAERLRQVASDRRPRALSFAQQRLWFLDQLEPNTALYNIAAVAKLEGDLDVDALGAAVNLIIARHEILRTRFLCADETPRQAVLPELKVAIRTVDVPGAGTEDAEPQVLRLIREEVRLPFNLSADPLLRCTLLRLDDHNYRLVLVFHHIVSDEWSLKVFWSELATAYTSLVSGKTPALPPLPWQYGEYSEWQRGWLQGELLEKQLAYWKTQLQAPPPPAELPADRPRPQAPTFAGASLSRDLGPELAAAVRQLAQGRKASAFMVLIAAFKALLYRYTRQEDLIVGSPIAGRNRMETEPLIGFFVNTLPLRTSLAGNPTFEELVGRVREVTLGAFAHQDLPFERIVHELQPERSLHHLPFARTMFVVQNGAMQELQLPGLRVEFLEYDGDLAKFDLTLFVQETARGLVAKAEYNRDLFDAPAIERLLQHFEVLLRAAVGNPGLRVSELPLLSPSERHQLLVEWNQSSTQYPRNKCIQELFEAQAAANPDRIAARFGEQSITYGELNGRANQLARYLQQFGVGQDRPVAICVRRSTAMVVGMLGILKAGAAYVPLDSRFPRERLQFILQDTEAPVLLTEQALLANAPRDAARIVYLDADWELIAREQRQNLALPASPEQLAYIMYTSGSTGQPKGVAVPHRGVVRLVVNTNFVALSPADRLAQVSNFSFDAATFEIWGALLNGGQLVGISGDVALSPGDFARELKEKGITAMFLTSALFNQLAAEVPGAFETLQTLIAGGEALDPKWVRAVLQDRPPRRLLNGYGPTENTTFTCCHAITELPPEATSVPIGQPIANTQVYILDPDLNPVPVGVAGELYTGGDGLARGYWRRPERTSEKFVTNPFRDLPGASQILYRTGDLAKYLADGSIEFLGRMDTQVKLRGFRIELGEIETVLGAHPGVRQCVVTLAGENSGKRLVAYVVSATGSAPNASELRAYLGEKLPAYMIPAAFVALDAIPLTPNGKVDRRALPAPDHDRPELERKYTPPGDEVELRLTRIWENVLSIRPIGTHDKFFDLGGHSLLAVKVIAQIEKKFGRKLRLATIFQAPTIFQLASVLREEIKESVITRKSSIVEIQGQGSRPPLFLVHGAGGGMFWGYVNLSRHLGTDQPVYAFRSRGLDGREEFNRIEQIAASYIADLRQVQPHGPYFLGGYCFGGNVAFEMARQLGEANEVVAFAGLLNCAPPNSRYTKIPWTPRWALRFARNLIYWANYCAHWSPTQRRDFVRWKWSLLKKKVSGIARRNHSPTFDQVQAGDLVDLSSYTEEERKVWRAHVDALVAFQPRPFKGKVHLFRSPGHPLWCSFDPDYGWSELAKGGVDITLVPGAHEKILEEPCVATLAQRLQQVLNNLPDIAKTEAARAGSPVPAASVGPREDYPSANGYACLFEKTVERSPATVAVSCNGEELTYDQLNRKANRLAHYLISRGAGPETLIAVCLERSIDLAVVLIGILKAGAAYLPLDPGYPRDRLNYMLADSKAQLIVTRAGLAQLLDGIGAERVVCMDAPEFAEALGQQRTHNPGILAGPDNLAYTIYTSGSTGRPKGVMISHRALLNHNFAVIQAYHISPSDRVLQFAPISFDVSVEEMFPTWLCGGAVVFRAEGVVSSPALFMDQAARDGITVLNLPTAFWHELVDSVQRKDAELPQCVRLVVVGGEKAAQESFRRWQQCVPPSVELINSYGVTEATITSTFYVAKPQDTDLPMGRPLPNTSALVLDERLQPVPFGSTGELFLAGAGLARGYLGRPELTAERFIPNPFPDVPSRLLYRTGDLVCLREDGNLEFLGRIDEQVKFRGYRIELGEIEAALREHPQIKDAAVVVREPSQGGKRLVGYYVLRMTPAIPPQQLAAFLKDKLPSYMVPSSFIQLEVLPLTPAGKIDRRALPQVANTRPWLAEAYVVPRTPLEEQLREIWEEVLGLRGVGVLDNFFDLGGHSLMGIQMTSRIRDRLNLDLPLNVLFAQPTIAALAAHLSQTAQPLMSFSPGSGARQLALTPAQRRVWFLDIFEPEKSPYNQPLVLKISGPLDVQILKRSLSGLLSRQEALRAVFPAEQGQPAQYILESRDALLPIVDFSDLPEPERSSAALKRAAAEAARTHITLQPALRSLLFRLGAEQHWLILIVHELVADQRSLHLLLRELASFYDGFASGSQAELPPLQAPYSELASCIQVSAGVKEQTLQYWSETLRGAPPLLSFPADRPRPDHQTDDGARCELRVSDEVARRLEKLAAETGTSLFTVLLAAYASLLSRHCNTTEMVIGTVVPREPGALGRTVANLENKVALRCDLSNEPGFPELLSRMHLVIEGARKHAGVAFAEVLEYLNPERNASYTPLFQVMLRLSDSPLPPVRAGGVEFVPLEIDNGTAQLDLALSLTRSIEGLSGFIEYSTDLFDEPRINRFKAHFTKLLEEIVAAPALPAKTLPILSETEVADLQSWNATAAAWPSDETLPGLFIQQVLKTPTAEAIVARNERLTYEELAARAYAIALELRQRGAGGEVLVGICLDRSADMVAAILGTLIAGAAYVPLDPAYPRERLAFILNDAKAVVLLTERKYLGLFPTGDAKVVCIDDLPASATAGTQPPAITARPENLAYVIYTSGSTGQPKGVALEHRNAVSFVSWAIHAFTPDELKGVLAATSICFDLSVFELFVPLCSGGKVVLAENALALPGLPCAEEVTLVNTVPSAIRELLRVGGIPDSVKVVNLAGEPLPASLADAIYSGTKVQKVYDLYGPTETTTYSTCCLRQPGGPASIGRPLANEQVYILDSLLQMAPIGVPGELFIGGAGVARGYLNRPELTSQRFIQNPFEPGARLYRTGDLARWQEDGTLQYLGRIDHQVKIRGFRIELGEIEVALKGLSGVRECVVVAREDRPGDKRLVAYLVKADETATGQEDLRKRLKERLPEYMVPAAFVWLDRLPLTPNGKVDRKALPAPEAQERPASEFVAPRSSIEEQVAAIWREVLHQKQVSVTDNFFNLGGHSLLAIQVISRIRETFKVELPLFALFTAPTVAALSEGLTAGLWTANEKPVLPLVKASRDGVVPAAFVQERLWFLHQLDSRSAAYNVPAALRLTGPLDVRLLELALNQVIARHESLRTTFRYQDDQLSQIIAPSLSLRIAVGDLTAGQSQSSEELASNWLKSEANEPFDLAAGPLLRVGVAKLGPADHVLSVVMHHTISDGWSLTVFFQELALLYDKAVSGTDTISLPELEVQYADFAVWQRASLTAPILDREIAYWKDSLHGAPSRIELPIDHQESENPVDAAGRVAVAVPLAVGAQIVELGHKQGATPFMVLLGALAVTLARWTGQRDLVLGTVVAGRHRKEIESLVGCFMNFLPLRVQVDPSETCEKLLLNCRKVVLEGQEHQDCPFEKIVEAVNPKRRLKGNPLYNVALLLQNFPAEMFSTKSVRATSIPAATDAPLLDLRFEAEQAASGLNITCEYRANLFEASTIKALLDSYVAAIEAVTCRPGSRLEEVRLAEALSTQRASPLPGEKSQQLVIAATFTAEPVAEPLRYWLGEMEASAKLEFAPYNQVFQQLLDPASEMAANPSGLNVILLRLEDWCQAGTAGESAEENLRRNIREFTAALKTAAGRSATPFFVCICPVSPAHEGEHPCRVLEENLLRDLLEVSGVYLLGSEELAALYPVSDYHDAAGQELGHVPYTPVFFTALGTAIARKFHALNRKPFKVIALDCDNTLWGGVCGEDGPKGIQLDEPWRVLQSFMRAQLEAGMLLCLCSKNNEEDVWEVFSARPDMPLAKDHFAAVRLNWGPKSQNLKALATELNLGLDSFIFLDDNPVECAEVEANCPEVAVLQLPKDPSQIPAFLKHCWAFDHLKITSEDRKRLESYRQNRQREQLRASSTTLREFLEGLQLDVRVAPMSPADVPRVAQLTQRTNQFNTTSRRLTEQEVQRLAGDKQFLTVHVSDRFGDYGLAGVVWYALNKRGLEVQNLLLSCRVLGRGVEHRVLSYLGQLGQLHGAEWIDVHFVRSPKNKPAYDFLATVGKDFQQPLNGGFVFRFPDAYAAALKFEAPLAQASPGLETGTEKTRAEAVAGTSRFRQYGRIALQSRDPGAIHQLLESRQNSRNSGTIPYCGPSNSLEESLAALWQKLLRIDRVGVRDDFFELGGHSLLAVRLFAEIEKITGRKLPLVTLFQAPTIEKLARVLASEDSAGAGSLLVPVQPDGSRPPLFLVHGAGGDVLWGYANLAGHMPADQPIYGIKSRGQLGLEESSTVEEMASYYIQAVRHLQPKGPYFLGGYCFGGNVAYEMARQLRVAGETVGLVLLLDSAPANAGYETVTWWRPGYVWRFTSNFGDWLHDFAALKASERRAFVGRKLRAFSRKLVRKLGGKPPTDEVDIEEVIDPTHFPAQELKLWQVHLQAITRHVEQPYPGEVHLLRTRGQPLFCSLEDDFCWSRVAQGGVRVTVIPGSHENVFMEPHVRELAKRLDALLRGAQAAVQPGRQESDKIAA